MLYIRKINLIFSDIQNRIFDFEVAALDMMNFEWSYIFPGSQINPPFVVSFIFLGDIGETKLIREATLKNHIIWFPAGNFNFEIWAVIAWVST